MEAYFVHGDKVTHSDEDDDTHTSSLKFDDISSHVKAQEAKQEMEAEEESSQTRRKTDSEEPRSRKRSHVDDDDILPYSDDDGHSQTSLRHSTHRHEHKRKRISPLSASMRLYKHSLSLTLQRARRQPITRSLTTRITRSGAKFVRHDQDSNLPSPSQRSLNLHGPCCHTPTSNGFQLHGSSRRSHALHAAKRSSPSEKDELSKGNEDIAIRYLNSSPSVYALLDLGFDSKDELLPSSSNANQPYMGPEMDIAIKKGSSSPKLYTPCDDIDLDSSTPSHPKASFPAVKCSPIRARSLSNLKQSPRTRVSPSSSSPQDHRSSGPTSSSSVSSKFKPPSHKRVDHRFSSQSPSPVYSPISPKYTSSSEGPTRSPLFPIPSPYYSPSSSSSKSYNHLVSSRLPPPVCSPISATYKAPSPPWSSRLQGSLPCPVKPSSPRTFKLGGSPLRSPSKATSLMSPSFKSSPRKGFLSRSSSGQSFRSPNLTSSPKRDTHRPQTSLTSQNKSSDNVHELIQSLSPYWSTFDSKSSPPHFPTSNSRRSSLNRWPPSNLNSTCNLPYTDSSPHHNPCAPYPPSFSPRESSRARSPSISSQGSPTSTTFDDYWSQIRRTYSLFPSSPPKPCSNSPQSSLHMSPPTPLAATSNSSRIKRSHPHMQTLKQPSLNFSLSHQSRLPSPYGQGSPSVDDFWSKVGKKGSLFSASLLQGSSSSRSPPIRPCRVRSLPTMVPQYEAASPPLVLRSQPSPCQHHVTFATSPGSWNQLTSGGLRANTAIHSHATQHKPGNAGRWEVNRTQNNRSRPYRSTPHPNHVPQPKTYLQTSSSETLGKSSNGLPSNKATSVRPSGGKICSSFESLGKKVETPPLHSHGRLQSHTSSPCASYYSALSTPSSFQDMSSSSYYSALSTPSRFQDMSSSSYYSAPSTPSRSWSSYYSAPSEPSTFQDMSSSSYYSALSMPSRIQNVSSAGTHNMQLPSSRARIHKDLDSCPSDEGTYYTAMSTPSPSFCNSKAAMQQKAFNRCPSEQETYYSAQRTPSPSFKYTTTQKNFDHYPLTGRLGENTGGQSPSPSCSQGSYSGIPSRLAINKQGASTSSSGYGDYNRASSARVSGPAFSSSRGYGHSNSARSSTARSCSSRKRPCTRDFDGPSKMRRRSI